ncbi:2Fe-2S iron-sulfur cluster-binding protein [Amphritea sp. HPY]|uniref:2Fe-2S iron-sulfur cluster-binding protein n=1 Tax=Amphritea sp. HPY TaxID=3421652 RepID=UPI003D7C5404
MGHKFAEIAFTESVREVQQEMGSRSGYAGMDEGEDYNYLLSQHEADFLTARDSFYMASVSETGWPYLQHRGGPAGFLKVIDESRIGFADFSGNRQYVSVGNFKKDDRVALFFMDYPNRRRLKMLGRVEIIGTDQAELLQELEVDDYRARVERGFIIHIEAFDWNCPQHITPRYTDAYVEQLVATVQSENQALKSELQNGVRQVVSDVVPEVLGDGELELMITGIRQLTPRVRSYELRAPDGSDLPVFTAGAHLQVPVQLSDGEVVIRHYSICSNPARQDRYRIAVLREDDGSGGSVAVHRTFELGLRLRCSLPQNHFALHAGPANTVANTVANKSPANRAASSVLIAGGIGITPIMAMAQTLKQQGRVMQLHYAGRSLNEMAFHQQLQAEMGDALALYSSADQQRLDIERILSTASADTMFYICGPARLLDAVVDTASRLKIDPQRVRFERFTAAPIADAKPIQLELRRSCKTIEVPADETVLDAMLEAGVDAAFGCKAGNCKSCAVKVLDGEPDHRDSALSVEEREQGRLICPCVSRSSSEHLVLDI